MQALVHYYTEKTCISGHYDDITKTPNKHNTFSLGIFHKGPTVF